MKVSKTGEDQGGASSLKKVTLDWPFIQHDSHSQRRKLQYNLCILLLTGILFETLNSPALQ